MSLIQRASPQRTRCSVRLLICAVSLLFSFSFGGELGKEDIKRAVISELELTFGDRVRLKEITVHLSSPVIFKGNIQIKVKLSVREGLPRGSAIVTLSSADVRRKVGVSLSLLWKCKRLVAVEPIRRGERVFPHRVEEKESFVQRCTPVPFKNPGELIDYVAVRDIPAGSEIRRSFLSKKPMVRAGDKVTILYRRGGLEIRFDGRALGRGFYREEVPVRSLNTGKVLRGKVIADGIVVVR